MEYKIEYVQHNRAVPSSQVLDYGKLATHDMRIPVLLLYELGRIPDANGNVVDINKEFINRTLEITNKVIATRHKNPLARFISKWNKPIEETTLIPLTKDHDTKTVDKKIGHIEGQLFTETIEGKLCLMGTALITDLDGKIDIESGKLREISIGTRPDGSIKEVSMVTNEAAPLCGLMFSEPNFSKTSTEPLELKEISTETVSKTSKEIQLSELQMAESTLEHVTIPNHIIISRMIKSGKMYPYQYEKAIKMDRSVLEFAESSIPSRDLGLMFGTNKQPQSIKSEEFKFETMLAEAQEKLGIKKDKPKQFEMIRQDFNFEEHRSKELKRMLELAESSPELVKQYIKYELGEESSDSTYRDEYLDEYLVQLSEIKQQLKSLQFGE